MSRRTISSGSQYLTMFTIADIFHLSTNCGREAAVNLRPHCRRTMELIEGARIMKSPASKKNGTKTKVIKQKVVIPARPAKCMTLYRCPKALCVHGRKSNVQPEGGRENFSLGWIYQRKESKACCRKNEFNRNGLPRLDWRVSASILDLSFTKKGSGTELTMIHSNVSCCFGLFIRYRLERSYWTLLKNIFKKESRIKVYAKQSSSKRQSFFFGLPLFLSTGDASIHGLF